MNLKNDWFGNTPDDLQAVSRTESHKITALWAGGTCMETRVSAQATPEDAADPTRPPLSRSPVRATTAADLAGLLLVCSSVFINDEDMFDYLAKRK